MDHLKTYWEQLEYDYLKTFSGLRGGAFKLLKIATQNDIKALEQQLLTARFMERLKIKKQMAELESQINLYETRIVDHSGPCHASTVEVAKIIKGEELEMKLVELLSLNFKDGVAAACIPVFRDAIVFYSNADEVKGILHICFSCLDIKNEKEENLQVDVNVFEGLQRLLEKMGHPIGLDKF